MSRIALSIVFVLVALVALACAPAPTPVPPPPATPAPVATAAPIATGVPAATNAPAAGGTAKPVRHLVYGSPVTPPNMVHIAPFVAQEMGFFKEVGLDVEFKSFEGGIGAFRGMVSGGLDVAGTSADSLMVAISQGVQVHAIGTYAPKLSQVMVS
ncbi:MAG: ABC transporter substrate-binding protein, partial [Acidobacteriota bacterium]